MVKSANKALKKAKHPFSKTIMQMVKRLRLDLDKFGDLTEHYEGNWRSPLPEFIRMLYEKRFGKRFSKAREGAESKKVKR